MDIKRSGSQPSGKGPAEYFTGAVRIDPLIQASDPGTCARCQCYVRARCSDRMAYASARADPDRDVRMWVGAKRGWPETGNSAGRCGLVPAG